MINHASCGCVIGALVTRECNAPRRASRTVVSGVLTILYTHCRLHRVEKEREKGKFRVSAGARIQVRAKIWIAAGCCTRFPYRATHVSPAARRLAPFFSSFFLVRPFNRLPSGRNPSAIRLWDFDEEALYIMRGSRLCVCVGKPRCTARPTFTTPPPRAPPKHNAERGYMYAGCRSCSRPRFRSYRSFVFFRAPAPPAPNGTV